MASAPPCAPCCADAVRTSGPASNDCTTVTDETREVLLLLTAGSRIVERLLSCGHGVHVLCRPRLAPGPGDMVQYLKVRLRQHSSFHDTRYYILALLTPAVHAYAQHNES